MLFYEVIILRYYWSMTNNPYNFIDRSILQSLKNVGKATNMNPGASKKER